MVVTGIGLITPAGKNKDENWDNIRNGRSGIGPITRFDASRHASRIAGEIKNFDPNQYFRPEGPERNSTPSSSSP